MSSPAENFLNALANELRDASRHRLDLATRQPTGFLVAHETAGLVLADLATAIVRALGALRE